MIPLSFYRSQHSWLNSQQLWEGPIRSAVKLGISSAITHESNWQGEGEIFVQLEILNLVLPILPSFIFILLSPDMYPPFQSAPFPHHVLIETSLHLSPPLWPLCSGSFCHIKYHYSLLNQLQAHSLPKSISCNFRIQRVFPHLTS